LISLTKLPDLSNPPLCACGCGKKVKWDYHRRRWSRFVLGHGSKRVPFNFLHGKPPKCACGCGKPVKWDDSRAQWSKYLKGHRPKIPSRRRVYPKPKNAPPKCVCGCGRRVPWNYYTGRWRRFATTNCFIKVLVQSRFNLSILLGRLSGEPPKCACGCGRRVRWNFLENRWNTYARNHGPIPVDAGEAPLCACGCGQPARWNHGEKRWNKYLQGHFSVERALKLLTKAKTARSFNLFFHLFRTVANKAGIPITHQNELLRSIGVIPIDMLR